MRTADPSLHVRKSATDDFFLYGCGRKSAFDLLHGQKEVNADAIVIACTGMANIGIIQEMRKELDIPVIAPVLCEGAFALMELLEREPDMTGQC